MDTSALQNKMRAAFRIEATDLLEELDSSMLELESRPQDTDLLNRVFRAIHTIKGSGATAGFSDMAAFTHHVEELFDEARVGRLIITPPIIDLALKAKDLIGKLMDAQPSADLQAICAEVVKTLGQYLPHRKPANTPKAKTAPTQSAGFQKFTIYFKPCSEVFFSGTDPVNLLDELSTLGKFQLEANTSAIPSLEELNPEHCYLAWNITLTTEKNLDQVKEIFLFVEDESDLKITSEPVHSTPSYGARRDAFVILADQSAEALDLFHTQLLESTQPDPSLIEKYARILTTLQNAASNQQEPRLELALTSHLKLVQSYKSNPTALSPDRQRVLKDSFATLVSALAQIKSPAQHSNAPTPDPKDSPQVRESTSTQPTTDNPKQENSNTAPSIRVDQDKLDRLMQAVGELLVARNALPVLAQKLTTQTDIGSIGKEVKDAGAHISRIAEDLQAAVMSIRMMAIRTVFQKFPRLARDICRAQSKEAKIILEGEDTELDKTVIEQIGDPLVHLVRNALDHGIELPDDREKAGKPRAGTVHLRAYNKGTNVVVEVQDDGKGMDVQRIKKKAVEKGLITQAHADSLSEAAALELIFLPGLSTADKVTDLSGRGVGMDVVKSNIQKLQGTTTLESTLGKGSKLTITLPTSLMVSKGILVESQGEEYVLPIDSVSEMVNIPKTQIHRHENQHFASVRNQVYSVLRLADYFGDSTTTSSSKEWPENVALAIVQTDQHRIGVAVDRFVRDVDVIVKPMGRDLANITAFRGASIMGDGRVVLVVNPGGMF